jgi:serine/threonine protein kinase
MELPDTTLAHLAAALRAPGGPSGPGGPGGPGTRYELGPEIGRGGMGAVFRARDAELGRDVAIKVLAEGLRDPGLVERLRREARIAAGLEHPGIVPVYDVGTLPDGRPYYVMKLVGGARLDAWIASTAGRDARLDVFLRICEAVAYAHAHGVVHRDLKPENVCVGAFGEVQVLDFGVAKLLADAAAARASDARAPASPTSPGPSPASPGTSPGTIVGTPGWMAPEQARGEAGVDARADVHALGSLLEALLARAAEPVPRALRAIAAKARAEQRESRYARAEDLALDVRRYRAGEAVSALPETVLERAGRLARRHQVALALVLVYLLMRVAILFFGRT